MTPKKKQKRKPTLVHQAIRKTLHDRPDEFSILNGGMAIVARGATVPSIKFEVIVTNDDDLIAEISIARNFQNDVLAISIVANLTNLGSLRAVEGVERASGRSSARMVFDLRVVLEINEIALEFTLGLRSVDNAGAI